MTQKMRNCLFQMSYKIILKSENPFLFINRVFLTFKKKLRQLEECAYIEKMRTIFVNVAF